MQVSYDDKYADLAAAFQYEQVRRLKAVLEQHGVSREVAKAICGDFTFELAMLLDQGELTVDGESYSPCLAFAPENDETLYAQPAAVEYHEYAFGTTADVFKLG